MKKILLNVIHLNSVGMNVVGSTLKKVIRYIKDGEVPATHTPFYDADSQRFMTSDAGFNVVKE